MRRIVSFGLILVLAIMALAGCSGEPSNTKESSSSQTREELVFNSKSEPSNLNPLTSTDVTSFWIINHMFEGLYWKDKDGEPELAAAENVELSNDDKTYTFTLRDDAKWSNGDPVVADDFVYSILQHLNPMVGSTTAYRLYYVKGAQEYNEGNGKVEDVGVKAIDEKTLQIDLVAPTSFFPKLLATQYFVPINRKVAEENPNWASEADSYVSNGAYKLTSWNHDSELKIERNEHYWNQDDVSMPKITWKMISEATTYYQMFKTGELDVVQDLTRDILEKENDGSNLVPQSLFATYMYLLNVEKPPFNNKKVREAFAMAVDRDLITEQVTKGGEKPAYAMVPPGAITPSGNDFREEKGDYLKYDPTEAKRLLQEGMKEEGWTTFPETTLLYNTDDTHKRVALAVQEMLKNNLGVEIKLENQETKVQLDNIKQKNFQMARSSWNPAVADPVFALDRFSGESDGNTGWINEEYVKLKAAATVEGDVDKRNEMLHQAEDMLMEDLTFIPVFYPTQNYLVQPGITGLSFPNGLYPFARWAK